MSAPMRLVRGVPASRPVTILADFRRYQAWTEVLRLIDRQNGILSLGGEASQAQRNELLAAWNAARSLDK
jgi:hypothetical protein